MILEAMAVHTLERPCRHVSLHYDGLMVDAEVAGDPDEFAAECARVVADQTGYVVQIKQKMHYSMLDRLKTNATMRMEVGGSRILLADGNCIPAAAAFVTAQAALVESEVAKNNAVNRRAALNKFRSYKDVRAQLLGDSLFMFLWSAI